jgi:glycosyltransferase involved in cell wall biosynthesis
MMGQTGDRSSEMPSVRVLLSTYNGGRYLQELLNSLTAQQGVAVKLLVRDDGSIDATPSILCEAAASMHDTTMTLGCNKGVVCSFLELIETCPRDAQYYAFCDQDDVWLPTKLERAVQQLTAAEDDVPTLYCSRLLVTDSLLGHSRLTPLPRRPLGLSNALVQNVATGCTIVMNARAFALLQDRKPSPDCLRMHDSWAYLVVSACGRVVYDSVPEILYRQHEGNVIGSPSGLRALGRRLAHVLDGGGRHRLMLQDLELRELYGDIMEVHRLLLLDRFLSGATSSQLSGRLRYVLENQVWRQRRIDDVALKMVMVLGGYRVR